MSITDTKTVQFAIENVKDHFESMMLQLFEEEPEAFEGRSTRNEWEDQVARANIMLKARLQKAVEEIELYLHDGQFSSRLEYPQTGGEHYDTVSSCD